VKLYHYFVSRSSEFCLHNPLCCFSTIICCSFCYLLSPETYGYILVCRTVFSACSIHPDVCCPGDGYFFIAQCTLSVGNTNQFNTMKTYTTFWSVKLKGRSYSEDLGVNGRIIQECIQKFPDWVDNEIYAYNNKHSLRSDTKNYDNKIHWMTHKIATQLHLVAES
jgi:hypothetical protein